MYRGVVPKVANQFPQSMFARERDEDIEPVKAQKDRQYRHNRASKLDEDDEDLEPVVKIPVRSHHTRASYLDSDKDNAPIKTSKARSRYSVASCLDDDDDAEPVMKLEVSSHTQVFSFVCISKCQKRDYFSYKKFALFCFLC